MTKVQAFEAIPTSTNSTPKTETLIQLVLDETGSMMSCLDGTISSFNEFIQSQAKVSDGNTCVVNLTKFSSLGAWDPSPTHANVRHEYNSVDISAVPELTKKNFIPTGMTNLYDAIGSTISQLKTQVKDHQNVLVVILTDGGENSSTEYNSEAIRTLIEAQQAEGWTFVFLGANQDAWQVGSKMGLSKGQTMTYDTNDMAGTMATLNMATTAYRSARSLFATDNKSGEVARDFFDGGKNG